MIQKTKCLQQIIIKSLLQLQLYIVTSFCLSICRVEIRIFSITLYTTDSVFFQNSFISQYSLVIGLQFENQIIDIEMLLLNQIFYNILFPKRNLMHMHCKNYKRNYEFEIYQKSLHIFNNFKSKISNPRCTYVLGF